MVSAIMISQALIPGEMTAETMITTATGVETMTLQTSTRASNVASASSKEATLTTPFTLPGDQVARNASTISALLTTGEMTVTTIGSTPAGAATTTPTPSTQRRNAASAVLCRPTPQPSRRASISVRLLIPMVTIAIGMNYRVIQYTVDTLTGKISRPRNNAVSAKNGEQQ